jgi:hypothetical protein
VNKAGFEVRTFEQLSLRGEQDPWAFYQCGKNGYVLLTSDKAFLGHFTHMTAIQLGRTAVFAFTSGNENMKLRGKAFVLAKSRILHAIRNNDAPFVASIGSNGTVTLLDKRPGPMKRLCQPEHWASYVRVCRAEGVEIHEEAYSYPGSAVLRGGGDGHPEDQADAEGLKEKAEGKEAAK